MAFEIWSYDNGEQEEVGEKMQECPTLTEEFLGVEPLASQLLESKIKLEFLLIPNHNRSNQKLN